MSDEAAHLAWFARAWAGVLTGTLSLHEMAAGWLAKQSGVPMTVVPLLEEPDRPPLTFRIALGVRMEENDWKRSLNTILRKRRTDIEKVLRDFDVPLLEEEGNKLLEAPKP